MIVICTQCQAKFRVADEKIGARGAKVRCSRCQTVFLVQPGAGAGIAPPAAAARVELEPRSGAVRAARAENPFVENPVAASHHFAVPPAGGDPFAAPAPPTDPFSAAAAPRPPGADPFAEADGSRATLAVTDLSDLLGPAAPRAVNRPASGPPPLPPAARRAPSTAADPFAGVAAAAAPPSFDPAPPFEPAPSFDPEPSFEAAPSIEAAPPSFEPAPSLDPEPSFEPAPPFEMVAPTDLSPPGPAAVPFSAAAVLEAADPFTQASAVPAELPPMDAAADPDDGGLSLEDRLTPPPMKVAPPRELGGGFDAPLEVASPLAGDDPFGPGTSLEPFDPGRFDFGGAPIGEDLAIAGESPAHPAAAPAFAPDPAAPAPAPESPPRAAAAVPAAAPRPEARIPGARGSRVRAVAANAVALAVLLLAALALWVVWRSDGPLEAASLRPSAILGALGRGTGVSPWLAQDVRSGVFERERAAPLLFVRGNVISRAAAPVHAVKVSVEVVHRGQVVARGEAIAGAVPTAEELYVAADEPGLQRARGVAHARAPANVKPGDSVPFLVAIGDSPPDLDGASLRVAVEPAGSQP